MPSLHIHELPPDIYEVLRSRAEREGRSLAQQAITDLRKVFGLEARQRRMTTLENLRSRLAESGTPRDLPAPEELIREDRDR